MSCVIYHLHGETLPALLAEAKLKNGGAAQAIHEALIIDNELIVKFDGSTEIPNHHRELIASALSMPGVSVYVEVDPKFTGMLFSHLETIRARLRQRNKTL